MGACARSARPNLREIFVGYLARIIHKFSTAAWEFPAPTALRSVGLLDVLHEYASGGLGRKPCQNGPSPASLRKLMNNPG